MSLTGETCLRLAAHMNVEENVLYPALRAAVGTDKVDEGIVEHDLAKSLIRDLVHMTGGEELYRSKVHVLGEVVMHHVDEEDRGLLRDARTAWEVRDPIRSSGAGFESRILGGTWPRQAIAGNDDRPIARNPAYRPRRRLRGTWMQRSVTVAEQGG